MTRLATLIQNLRKDPRLFKIPPYLSGLCILIGVAWLFLLPLDEYSRETYMSEGALLPAQVHTYFGGSEHHVFRAYRHEVWALSGKSGGEIAEELGTVFKSHGLRVARQKYKYSSSASTNSQPVQGENVYSVLRGPRADATEAIVLVASWRDNDGELNTSGVALVLTLARYFKRWSLWSKDIIFLITEDSIAGPQAWVDAYHDAHNKDLVDSLAIKSGALQGAVVVDYTAGPGGRRYEKLHILYDGANGQLANLDLINTVVKIAKNQVGMHSTFQQMWHHGGTYWDRLETMFRAMLSQGVGHASGPHSAFIPYHVDALTLQTVGDDGNQDEITLGRVVEGTVRSLNNLLEHLHQSFFFYLLFQPDRFVSIGTYLPSAMLIAVNFTITTIALWIQSGRPASSSLAPTKPAKQAATGKEQSSDKETSNGTVEPVSEPNVPPLERKLFMPLVLLSSVHFLGMLALQLFTRASTSPSPTMALAVHVTTLALPHVIAAAVTSVRPLSLQEAQLTICFVTLLLGMSLSTLSTLNFSLSLLLGLLAAPLSFIRPFNPASIAAAASTTSTKQTSKSTSKSTRPPILPSTLHTLLLAPLSPPSILLFAATYHVLTTSPASPLSALPRTQLSTLFTNQHLPALLHALRVLVTNTRAWGNLWAQVVGETAKLLAAARYGYVVSGAWTGPVVALVWWPAWVAASVVASPALGICV